MKRKKYVVLIILENIFNLNYFIKVSKNAKYIFLKTKLFQNTKKRFHKKEKSTGHNNNYLKLSIIS